MGDRRHDYYLPVTLEADDVTVETIPCKVYLPLKVTDLIELHLFVNEKQGEIISFRSGRFWKSTLRGELLHGATLTQLHGTVYVTQWPRFHWNSEFYEILVKVEPEYLEITDIHYHIASHPQPVGSNVDSTSSTDGTPFMHNAPLARVGPTRRKDAPVPGSRRATRGVFWLTTNDFLNTFRTFGHHLDGSIEVKTGPRLEFILSGRQKLIFDEQARWTHNDNGDKVTFFEQVAAFKFTSAMHKKAGISPELLRDVDDFLLLTSFASRRRTVCVGWGYSHGAAHTRHYRHDITIPSSIAKQDLDDALIDRGHFEEFITQAYGVFSVAPEEMKENLRQVLGRIVFSLDRDLESGFVLLYSALESLVTHFRRTVGLEEVFTRGEWKHVRRSIKAALSSVELVDDADVKKALLLEKLPELNRVSFATAFRRFCQAEVHHVELYNLWPAVGERSLSNIRNELVHGETFRREREFALYSAKLHLQWTVERMILALLQWPMSKSNVRPNFLRHLKAYTSWHGGRVLLCGPEREQAGEQEQNANASTDLSTSMGSPTPPQ